MKRSMLPLFFMICAQAVPVAVAEIMTGTEYNVITSAGLNLRESPSPQGKKSGITPFGSKVTVLEATKATYESENIRGVWVKVRAGEKTGYAFSGYLSRLTAPPKACKNIKHYLDTVFAQGKTVVPEGSVYEYGPGGRFGWLGGDVYTWEVDNVSPEEIFLIARHCKEIHGKKFTRNKDSDSYSEGVGQLEARISRNGKTTIFVKDI